jgi:alkanesulfonate monooxygenase SsuD/methylene tetrahydromethanopterin reductase-like flavin-dependent oxidoreductase (luciferase family)
MKTLRDTTQARSIIDLYKAEWRRHGRPDAELPMMGINRHIVVAPTEAEARDIAHRAYRPWRRHMELLWAKYDVPFPLKAALPDEWDPLQAHGHSIAGTPDQVGDFIASQAEAAGATYFVCDFAFGTISHAEAMQSVELFARDVMPAFAEARPSA